MPYTKIYFKTKDKKTGKTGRILAIISENKCMARFDSHQQGEMTYRKLISEGKRAIFERGVVIQVFRDMTQKQIVDLVREDIKITSPSVGIEILDYQEETIK